MRSGTTLLRLLTGTALMLAVVGCSTGDSANTASAGTPKKVVASGGEDECCTVETKLAVAAPATRPTTGPSTGPAAADNPTTAHSAPAAAAAEAPWRDLFDGKTLTGWKPSGFAAQGEPEVKDGALLLPVGEGLTGVTFTGPDLPKTNYEVEVVAKRVDGGDFFCGLTVPVNGAHASLIIGGWGGAVVGISSINDDDAAHNETTTYQKFESGRWYAVRLRVLPDRLSAWIDGRQVVNADIKGKKVDIRTGIDEARPLGLAAWQTTAAVKSVRIRKVEGAK